MPNHARFEVLRARNGEYFWHLRSGNNRLVCDSGETYRNKTDCVGMLKKIKAAAAKIPIEDKSMIVSIPIPH